MSGVPGHGKSQCFVLGNEGRGFKSVFLSLPSVKCYLSNKLAPCSEALQSFHLQIRFLHTPKSIDYRLITLKEETIFANGNFRPCYMHFHSRADVFFQPPRMLVSALVNCFIAGVSDKPGEREEPVWKTCC